MQVERILSWPSSLHSILWRKLSFMSMSCSGNQIGRNLINYALCPIVVFWARFPVEANGQYIRNTINGSNKATVLSYDWMTRMSDSRKLSNRGGIK
jgi:hypothetical protein